MVHTSPEELKRLYKNFNNLKTIADETAFLDSGILKEIGEPLFEDRYPLVKYKPTDTIWWVDFWNENDGDMYFSFDTKKFYNFWTDYPEKLTKDEKAIFDKENPEWVLFGRK